MNIEEISATIFLEGQKVQLNALGVPIRYQRDDLTTIAEVFLILILHNIRPKSHTSTFTLDTANLIFHLVNGRHVDMTHIIADELKMVVESGRQPGTKPSFPLVYPGLIMGLCMSTHMVLTPHVHETITRPIEDANISNYCTSRRTRETRQASAKTTNRGFSDWDPRMRFAGFYV